MIGPSSELSFVLEVVDDWPPVALECLLADKVDQSVYRLSNPPLFVKGLSVGDLIEVRLDQKNQVLSWKILKPSANSTIWISRLEKINQIESTLESLRKLGCASVDAPGLGCYSVDVPETVSMRDVDAILDSVDEATIGIAYPSFRHPE